MLTGLLETALALLAAAGLAGIGWLLWMRWLLPVGGGTDVWAVIAAQGDAAALEQAVRGLLWLRRQKLWRGGILIVDRGLDRSGRDLARLLTIHGEEIGMCAPEEMTDRI